MNSGNLQHNNSAVLLFMLNIILGLHIQLLWWVFVLLQLASSDQFWVTFTLNFPQFFTWGQSVFPFSTPGTHDFCVHLLNLCMTVAVPHKGYTLHALLQAQSNWFSWPDPICAQEGVHKSSLFSV